MAENFVEELVAELLQIKGYLVARNYWFPVTSRRYRRQRGKRQEYEAQSWTDIDILARNESELLVIQVKSIINDKRVIESVGTFFDRVIDYLNAGIAADGKSSILWWSRDVKIRKIVIYEWENSPPAYIDSIRELGIEVYPFGRYFNELREYIKTKKGVKEEKAVLRLLHFLKYHGYFASADESSI
jgi:hypothetical protein